MAESAFYVDVARPDPNQLAGLGSIIGRNREIRKQEEEQAAQAEAMQQAQTAIQDAIRSGDPMQIADVSIQYPGFRENIESAMTIGGEMREQQVNDEKSFYQSIITNPEGAADITRQRVEMLVNSGRDPSQSLELLSELENPETSEEALNTVESMYAMRFPDEYKTYQEALGSEDYNKPFLSDGTANPAYQEYQERLRMAGRSETNINLPSPTNKATETFGEGIGDRANTRLEHAQSAQSQNTQLERMSEALAEGARTGTGQASLLTLKNIGQSLFNLPISEEATEQEVIQALSNRLALEIRNPTSGLGLPGSTSNRDLNFLIGAVPGLQRTPEGNAQLIEYFMKINDMKQDVAQEQQRIIDENEGTVPFNLDSQLMKYLNDYELLDGDEEALISDILELTPEETPPEATRVGRFTITPVN